MKQSQKKRSEIDNQYKWKLEDIFASDAEWEKAFQSVKSELPVLNNYRGRLAESVNVLKTLIEKMHALEEDIGKLYAYAHMRNDEDKTVPEYQELYDRMNGLLVEYNQSVAFFEPELLALPDETLNNILAAPELEIYHHFLDNIIRGKKHTLSFPEERIMALAGEIQRSPAEIFGVWDSADIVFPTILDENEEEVQLTNALYGKFQQSPNRRLRKDAYMGLYQPFLEHRNMLAANYSAIVKSHVFNARARGYDSTLAAALDTNNIPVEIYHNLIGVTHESLAPLHRYNALRQKVLKLSDGVHDYDLRAPLFESKEKKFSWEAAKELCMKGVQPLGDDYLNVLKQSFNEGWIDVYENKGKRTGAYSSGTYGVHPYVLMNFNETMSDVFTLAHEMGHALHTWYTINNQPYLYGDYPIFLAEVASTANEALLQQYLIDNAKSAQEKLSYLNAYLDKFSQTFYRQVIFAEYELRTHEMVEQGQPLTADKLDSIFGEIYQAYHGPEFVLDRETKALWSRVPHFYYNYYVFQYSTSFVASSALVAKILNDGPEAREKFLTFLKSGRSKYPIDILDEAGVDMRTADPMRLTIQWMNTLLDEVEKLI